MYPLILVNLLFFLWGFIWNLNNVLVALFKETFGLSNFRASLLTSVSFLAFFAISYPAGFLIKRLRTQKSMILGTTLASAGLLTFIPAAKLLSFNLFLLGTFITFSGVTFLQIVCNPYVRALGPSKSAASRINLSQGLGAIGAFLTAYLAGGFILKLYADDPFTGIFWFYLIISIIFLLMAFLVRIARMPANPTDEIQLEKSPVDNVHIRPKERKKTAWNYRHFRIGFAVLLLYMGAEAVLYQLMTPYFMELAPISKARAVDISGILFLGLMVGRLSGAGILLKANPGKMVGYFAGIAGLLIMSSWVTGGYLAICSIVLTGFFISIMFATIYSLAIVGLGRFTNEASSFLIMAISGGFFLPLIFGLVADMFSLETSLIVVIIPLLLASWYGFFRAGKTKLKENI